MIISVLWNLEPCRPCTERMFLLITLQFNSELLRTVLDMVEKVLVAQGLYISAFKRLMCWYATMEITSILSWKNASCKNAPAGIHSISSARCFFWYSYDNYFKMYIFPCNSLEFSPRLPQGTNPEISFGILPRFINYFPEFLEIEVSCKIT